MSAVAERKSEKVLADIRDAAKWGVERLRLTGPDREDAVQAATVKLLIVARKYNGRGNWQGYLRRVAYREAVQWTRANRDALSTLPLLDAFLESRDGGELSPEEQVVSALSTGEIIEEFRRVLPRLPEGLRTVVEGRLEERSYAEIGATLGIRADAAKGRMCRAVRLLREWAFEDPVQHAA